VGVLLAFISKLLCKINLAGGTPFEHFLTHFFRMKIAELEMGKVGGRHRYGGWGHPP
jgi:hypothetical protein